MAYLNPYEGVGNALMGIGDNILREDARKKAEKALWERERKRAEEQAAQEELRAKERGLERDIDQGRWNAGLARDDIKEQQRQKERSEDRADTESYRKKQLALDAARIAANKNEEKAQQVIGADGRVMLRTGATAQPVLDEKGKPLMTAPPGSSQSQQNPYTAAKTLMEMAATREAGKSAYEEGTTEYNQAMKEAADLRARANKMLENVGKPTEVPLKQSTSSGVWDALGTGISAAMKYGRNEEAAAAAGMEGKVPPQVAADTLASMAGAPTSLGGATGTPNATGKKRETPTATKINPAYRAAALKAAEEARGAGLQFSEADIEAYVTGQLGIPKYKE